MKLKVIRQRIKALHAMAPLAINRGGAFVEINGQPLWYLVSRTMIDHTDRNYYTVGYALQEPSGGRHDHARRSKWFRRLLLRDLGLIEPTRRARQK